MATIILKVHCFLVRCDAGDIDKDITCLQGPENNFFNQHTSTDNPEL
jgi:hypothetical protein